MARAKLFDRARSSRTAATNRDTVEVFSLASDLLLVPVNFCPVFVWPLLEKRGRV
jgi:hypothetical protein